MKNNKNQNKKIVLFQNRKIRRAWYNNEWFYSVIDIVAVLTDSINPRDYWYKMKIRVNDEDGLELSTICRQFKLEAPDRKLRETDCANTESIFRIIQSIPSPKAEPFKRWLAKVGKERLDEIENPELAQERMKEIYEKKGYPKDWINKRLRGMAIRQNLTDEWKDRGIQSQKGYAILTAEISQKEKPKGMPQNKKVARRGGGVAGKARKETEKEIGRSVILDENFLGAGNEIKKLSSFEK